MFVIFKKDTFEGPQKGNSMISELCNSLILLIRGSLVQVQQGEREASQQCGAFLFD